MMRFNKSDVILCLGVLPLLFVPVWMGAGTFRPWQGSFIPLSIWAWICFWAAPAARDFPSRRNRLIRLLKDPCLWGALLFLMLLGVQTWNSGRMLLYHFRLNVYYYSPPPHPYLPGSFTRRESLEMLRWFIPVFSTFLIAKHALPVLVPRAFNWILLNSGLNAILALTHEFAGWHYMYEFWGWVKNPRDAGADTYGSFGYPNHAATYFILLFSFAAGLFLREVLQDRSRIRTLRLTAGGTLAILFFFTAQFSASRAGMLGVWFVLALLTATLAILAWPRLHPVQRLYGIAGMIFLLCILIAGFRTLANPVHLREFAKATTELDLGREVGARFFQVQSAWDIWKEHPWFGVGGWGYRYLVSFYLDPSMWGVLNRGKANVHNDFFQFLCEFGLVGMVCLSMVFLPSVLRIVRDIRRPADHDQSLWGDPLRFSTGFGLLLMIAHSMIDLPFRSPAVFAHAALFLVLASQWDGTLSVWPPVVDWLALRPAVRLRGGSRKQHPPSAPATKIKP